jgi:hypothetical protein
VLRKQFFFEKKNQKTFDSFGEAHGYHPPQGLPAIIKSFLVLFFKKELLPY